MINVEIVNMEHRHVKEVALLENKSFSMPWSEKAFDDVIDSDNYKYIVALVDGHVVGYAGMQHVLDEAEITNIAVASDMKRLGIATKLLETLEEIGRRNNIKYIHLEVREGNKPARTLYENQGFLVDGMRKNFYQKPTENAVLMTKAL